MTQNEAAPSPAEKDKGEKPRSWKTHVTKPKMTLRFEDYDDTEELDQFIAHLFGQITDNEERAISSAIAEVCPFDKQEFMSTAQVKRFFEVLDVRIHPDLLLDLMQETYGSVTNEFTLQDLLHIYVAWKSISGLWLPNTRDWTDSQTVKRVTATSLLLVDDPRRTAWNLFFMLAALTHWVTVLYRDDDEGLSRAIRPGFMAVDAILTIVYWVDIALWFRTSRLVDEDLVDTQQKARDVYLRTWFIPDALSALPLDLLTCAAGATVASAYLSHLRLLKLIRAFFLWGTSGLIPLTERYIRFHFQILPLLRMFYALLAITQLLAGLFLLVKRNSGGDALPGVQYVTAVYFIIQTVATVGYGDISIKTSAELWFAIIVLFLGLLINGTTIGILVGLLSQEDASTTRQDNLRETVAVLQYFKIPWQLQVEILNYQSHVLFSDIDAAFHNVTSSLPQPILHNIAILQRLRIIRHLPLFHKAHDCAAVMLAETLEHRTFRPEEYLATAGDEYGGVRFLVFGFVDRLEEGGKYIATLKAGDVFGDTDVLDAVVEGYSYKSISYCDVMVLHPDALFAVLQYFPRFAEALRSALDVTKVEVTHRASRSKSKSDGQSPKAIRIAELRLLHMKLKAFKEKLILLNQQERDADVTVF